MGTLPYALQLYTVRDHMAKDPRGTLEQVKKAGYDCVELAGTAGMTPADFSKVLADVGLRPISCHAGLDEMAKNVPGVIEMCRTLDIKFVVVPHASAETKEKVLENARIMDAAGAELRKAGIRLCYHNHAHEFVRFDGVYALDLLYQSTRPENLAAQLDTFWIKYGKADPVEVIKKYAGRCPLLHVKDMAPEGVKPIFADLGRGTMDWKPIFDAAKAAGVQWYIVEQDECPSDSIESARIAAGFMRRQ